MFTILLAIIVLYLFRNVIGAFLVAAIGIFAFCKIMDHTPHWVITIFCFLFLIFLIHKAFNIAGNIIEALDK